MPKSSQYQALAAAGVGAVCFGLVRARASILSSSEAYNNRRKGFCEDITVSGKSGSVELYHNSDSYCSQAARAALCEGLVEWESHHLELHPRGENLEAQLDDGYKFQHLRPSFKQINPWCTVPVLVHDRHPVYESKFIVEYVARNLAKKDILAKDPAHVQRMEFWMEQAYLDNIDGKTAGGSIPMLTARALIQQQASVKLRSIVYYFWNHPCRERAIAVPFVWMLVKLGLRNPPFSSGQHCPSLCRIV